MGAGTDKQPADAPTGDPRLCVSLRHMYNAGFRNGRVTHGRRASGERKPMNWLHGFASEGALLGPQDAVALARLALAALLGGTVALEREGHGRKAGLRTHLLLCTGC